METKMIVKVAHEIGIAQGMAGVACAFCGVLFTLVIRQHKEIRKIKERIGSMEEA